MCCAPPCSDSVSFKWTVNAPGGSLTNLRDNRRFMSAVVLSRLNRQHHDWSSKYGGLGRTWAQTDVSEWLKITDLRHQLTVPAYRQTDDAQIRLYCVIAHGRWRSVALRWVPIKNYTHPLTWMALENTLVKRKSNKDLIVAAAVATYYVNWRIVN